jgi:hypothetical protein
MLPDFRNVQTFEEIYSRFFASAKSLMLEHDLVFEVFKDTPLCITALELYLHCSTWPDKNTDQHLEQLNRGTWYVHRRGTNANTSRIDITAGSQSEKIYCGLLVRGIDGSDGSGKAIKKILRGRENTALSWLKDETDALDQIHGSHILEGPLRLVRREEARPNTLSPAPRVGLKYPEAPWSQNLRLCS